MSDTWCEGCVFEFRDHACGHSIDNCKKVIKALEELDKNE